MLFLFEFLFFLIAIGAVVLIETAGVEVATAVVLGLTLASLAAYVITARRVPLPAGRNRAAFHAAPEDARWWRTTLDTWTHFNRALLIGSAILLAWVAAVRLLVA